MKVLSNLMSLCVNNHMILVWTLTFQKLGGRKMKINKYVEENGTQSYKRIFGINLEMFPRSCIWTVWLFLNFVSNWKLDFKILWVAEILHFLHDFFYLTFKRNHKQLKWNSSINTMLNRQEFFTNYSGSCLKFWWN